MRPYLNAAKPGIVFGNAITVVGGYFLGSRGHLDVPLFLFTLAGISLVIASAGVFNNIIDRDIDQAMERTRKRALAAGSLEVRPATLYASLLAISGFSVLAITTNAIATVAALTGFLIYVGLYSLWLKRRSVHGTLAGSLSGAIPPIVGYTAAAGVLDTTVLVLGLMLCLWQMPHSYAIAIYRKDDFLKAGIPVLPLVKGMARTKIEIVLYTAAFVSASLLLPWMGRTGALYAMAAAAAGSAWLLSAATGFSILDERGWARRVFLGSILLITVLSTMMVVDQS